MSKCYVKAYYDWIEQTAALSDAERGRLFIAILEYARSGLEPKLDGRESILFPVFRATIDRDNKVAKTNAQNGALGGRGNKATESEIKRNKATESETKPTQEKRHKTQEKDKDKDKDKDYDKDESIKKAPRRFAPPSVEEVVSYCRERKNGVDAQRFVDFYASKGWKVGNNPMKDWKAAVRTWEGRDKEKQAASAKGIMQHTPTPAKSDLDNLKAIYERVKNG